MRSLVSLMATGLGAKGHADPHWWMHVVGVTPHQNVEPDTGLGEPELCRSRAIRCN